MSSRPGSLMWIENVYMNVPDGTSYSITPNFYPCDIKTKAFFLLLTYQCHQPHNLDISEKSKKNLPKKFLELISIFNKFSVHSIQKLFIFIYISNEHLEFENKMV